MLARSTTTARSPSLMPRSTDTYEDEDGNVYTFDPPYDDDPPVYDDDE